MGTHGDPQIASTIGSATLLSANRNGSAPSWEKKLYNDGNRVYGFLTVTNVT